VGSTLFQSYLIQQGGIKACFHSLWISLMLSTLWLPCMGSRYIVCMIMHDVVVMLFYYTDMLMIMHVHANVD